VLGPMLFILYTADLVSQSARFASVCVCRWHRRLDAGQSSAVKYRQDWPALVCDFSSSSSAAHFSSQDRVRPRQAVGLSQRSRNLLRRRPQHAMPHSENSCQLLRRCAVFDDQFRRQCTIRPSVLSLSQLWLPWLRQCCAGGLYTSLYLCLPSVLNAAGRSIAGIRHYSHITDTLASFH